MEFEPIKIKIKDLKLFADVAFTIDSPVFIRAANSLRKRFQITCPLGKNDYHSWVIKNIVEVRGKGKKATRQLFKKIREIRNQLYLTENYQIILEKAVFGCDILEKDYEVASLINFRMISDYSELVPLAYDADILNSNLYAILLTPQTRKKDVDELYRKYEKFREEFNVDTLCFEEKRDYKGEIKRDRVWYWKKKRRKTYLQIAKEDKGREEACIDPEDYKETVRKAIKAYEKALSPYFS